MTITLAFLALLMAVFVGWLISQSVNVSPWVPHTAEGYQAPHLPRGATAPRVGLAVFLAVVTSVFALTISAYMVRMEYGADWQPVAEPNLLWVNTAILLLGSVALQLAWSAAKHGIAATLRLGLMAGALCTVIFIIGQYMVWRQLNAAGYYATGNPANAFFYLLTALHAVHLLGGLVALAGPMRRAWRDADTSKVVPGIELCALYWHYLLALWVVLFALVLST